MHAPAQAPAPILADDFLTTPSPAGDDGSDGLDLERYLRALRRRWPLILVCCLIAVVYAVVRYVLTTKQYEATAMIQIERRQLASVALGGQPNWLESWWNIEYYPTQYRLLRSRGMAERVIENLRLSQDPTFTGKTASLIPEGEEGPTTAQHDVLRKANLASRLRGGLLVKPIRDTQLVELTYRSSSPERAAMVANGYAAAFIQWTEESRNQDVITVSSTIGTEIANRRREADRLRAELAQLSTDSIGTLDPEGQALISRQQTLQGQLNQQSADRVTKQATWNQYRNMTDAQLAGSIDNGNIATMRGELKGLEDRYERDLRVFEPTFRDMVALKSQIDSKRSELNAAIQSSAANARDTAQSEYSRARQQEQALEAEIRKVNQEATAQNSSAVAYANLKSRIESTEEGIDDLVERQEAAEFASRVQESQGSNVRLVDRAVIPGAPFRPVLRSDLTTALLTGLFVGLALVFLLEFFDRTIKTPEDLEKLTGLPTLAVVPDLNAREGSYRKGGRYGYRYGGDYGYGGQAYGERRSTYSRAKQRIGEAIGKSGDEAPPAIELLPHHHPRLAVSEAYRSLRTALLLSSTKTIKTVTITSAEPSEGKTSTTVNLAAVLAQMERRVLVLDCDLRRPRMHKVFGLSNAVGIVNHLAKQEDIEGQILATPVPNLWVCPSGPIPPNPSELLASERMRNLLMDLERRFDFVVIDTPPILPVIDAAIVGQLVDGVVICARAGVLVRDHARACRDRLNLGGIHLFGTVMNRFNAKAGSSYARRYYYADSYEEDDAAASATA